MGGAAPTPRLPRLRPRCPCYCSKFLANRSSRVARAWQPASQAGRPGSRQGSLGKSPGETRGQPWGRHDTYKPHPEAKATTLANSISGQPGVRCLQNKRSFRFCSKGSLRALRKFLSQRREFRAAPPTPRCTMLRGGCRRLGTEKSVYFARTDPLHFRQHCPPGGWGGRRETSLAKNIHPLGRRRSSAPWPDNERLFCKHRNKKSPQEGETWAPR